MLLCVDIGNTNIVIGIYRGEELLTHWRISTDHNKMPDEYGMLLVSLMAHHDLPMQDIDGVALASVVPPLTDTFVEMLEEYVRVKPLVIGSGTRTGVSVRYDNPHDVGADRVVNAAAAYRLYGGPTCIVDFGTATTFDALSAKGEYLGGAIAPGVRVAAEALFQRTAKLPRIDLQRPPKAVGSNTADAMRSGILFGYVGLVEGMVARFRRELGADMRVIGTGGLARVIAQETPVIEVVDPWLTLKGLRLIYDLNEGAR
jgi:type III pantothenate kinase